MLLHKLETNPCHILLWKRLSSSISVLIKFLDIQGEDIEKRIVKGHLLQENELDALKDFCQINFRSTANTHKNILPFSRKKETHERVSNVSIT